MVRKWLTISPAGRSRSRTSRRTARRVGRRPQSASSMGGAPISSCLSPDRICVSHILRRSVARPTPRAEWTVRDLLEHMMARVDRARLAAAGAATSGKGTATVPSRAAQLLTARGVVTGGGGGGRSAAVGISPDWSPSSQPRAEVRAHIAPAGWVRLDVGRGTNRKPLWAALSRTPRVRTREPSKRLATWPFSSSSPTTNRSSAGRVRRPPRNTAGLCGRGRGGRRRRGGSGLPSAAPRRRADGRPDARDGWHRGYAATRRRRRRPPRVLVLTTFDLDDYVYDALRAGASGFLLKDVTPSALFEAVRVVAAGGVARTRRHPATHRRVRAAPAPPGPVPTASGELTPRETEVLRLVARRVGQRRDRDRDSS